MRSSTNGWSIFKSLCLKTKDEGVLEQMLELLLTAEERENLAMRCLIVKDLLDGGKTQRQVAKDLDVSISKITRGSNELKRFDKKFLLNLQKMMIE